MLFLQRHAPAALLLEKTRYALYRRLGEHNNQSGPAHEISPPPGLDPRTVQLVESRYTDWAIAANTYTKHSANVYSYCCRD